MYRLITLMRAWVACNLQETIMPTRISAGEPTTTSGQTYRRLAITKAIQILAATTELFSLAWLISLARVLLVIHAVLIPQALD